MGTWLHWLLKETNDTRRRGRNTRQERGDNGVFVFWAGLEKARTGTRRSAGECSVLLERQTHQRNDRESSNTNQADNLLLTILTYVRTWIYVRVYVDTWMWVCANGRSV